MLDNDNSSADTDTTDSSPADTTGGATTARARGRSRAVPVKRIRVSALAKELGLPSKELIGLVAELGEGAKTASSTLDEPFADRVRAELAARRLGAEAAEPALAGPEPVAEPSAAEPGHGRPSFDAGPPVADESAPVAEPAAPVVLFQAPSAETVVAPRRRRRAASAPAGPPSVETTDAPEPVPAGPDVTVAEEAEDSTAEPEDVREAAEAEAVGAARKRRRRGRRGRGGGQRNAGEDETTEDSESDDTGERAEAETAEPETAEAAESAEGDDEGSDGDETSSTTRRRRRRRRSSGSSGNGGDASEDDPPNTVVHVREAREKAARESRDGRDAGDDGVKGVKGSTRLEARRQRRRDGRETNRRRPPILTESEFLARREAVDRVMAVRQSGDRTQIAVLEDDILVEHYVTRATATSYVGNVYLGRVQNVLPSMEAAFIDIGKGRNGVLYAGEVNWDAAGLEGKSRAIEQALKSGDTVLVQVTKDPIGHKGARLTSQVSLPGRFLVYVPGGGMTGISRRLPDTERHRLKSILKKIVPEDAGVIVRTAAEGASEEDLTSDVERLQAEWASISKKAEKTSAAPTLVHGEPDLAIRVVRDVFNEDFKKLVVQGEAAWQTVSEYIDGVAPDLAERVSHYTGGGDLFHDLRVDEQIMKALDRKVWLPSGGSLVIDRTEAMTVIDVNTGKFVGSGGNLEQTVTRNNLEAAEEIVRQLRLRDVGGIVVIDFIDMVLESNRELVLRRLTECLGRDRTKHQVAEVTSLGLVQMTRKRVGEGLLEAFSEPCEVCHGRGVILHSEPVDKGERANGAAASDDDGDGRPKSRRRRGKKADADEVAEVTPPLSSEQRTKALAAMNAIHRAANGDNAEELTELQFDAVTAVLAGGEVDADNLAAEVLVSRQSAAAATSVDGAEPVEPAAEPAEAAAKPLESVGAAEDEAVAEAVATAELAADLAGVPAGVPAEGGIAINGAAPVDAAVSPDGAASHDGATPDDAAEDDATTYGGGAPTVKTRPRRRRAASRPAGPPTTG